MHLRDARDNVESKLSSYTPVVLENGPVNVPEVKEMFVSPYNIERATNRAVPNFILKEILAVHQFLLKRETKKNLFCMPAFNDSVVGTSSRNIFIT